MKKGFTLIELLIVMVIVGVLVAVALPQYNRSIERGRALEGIASLREATDYVNAQYILRDFSYPSSVSSGQVDLLQNKYFNAPTISISNGAVTVTLQRDTSSGWSYSLYSTSAGGEITGSGCTNGTTEDVCTLLGLNEGVISSQAGD